MFTHHYSCDVCGEPYNYSHTDTAVHGEDTCPACGCADNDVVAIEEEHDANED